MRMEMKLVSFILMLTIVEAEPTIKVNLDLIKAIRSYLFPKDLGIIRVRKPEEVHTTTNNVTTLDFIGLVERHGYPAEEHYVTTEDGYNLVIHRIPGSPLFKGQKRKRVMFLQNGMLTSSDCWVLFGPSKDLAFLLADKGYDIWLGNYRGNSYCRSHVKLSSQDKDFWKFSFHEIGTKDLPAMIDYVLNYTKQETLRYIGFSMGTTVLFPLLSMKPEYNAKIKWGILLAPVAIWKERSPPVEYIRDQVPEIKKFLESNEIYELLPLSSTIITAARILCANTITQAICPTTIFLICGFDPAQLNTISISGLVSHSPAGISLQTLYHYYQNYITQKFQAYDYGYLGNYEQYRQMTPVKYDLNKITTPLALFYGANDFLVSKSSVLETYKHLPNGVLLEEVPYKLFNHLDFLLANDVKTLLYDRILELLENHENWDK